MHETRHETGDGGVPILVAGQVSARATSTVEKTRLWTTTSTPEYEREKGEAQVAILKGDQWIE